ncbi:MAG TPA: ABC transporter ATP-binding protein [Gammaproteobacteria bacterium]|jgi:lipopolysaccharide transport system ATP-binding protein|nr:ABC transporter ATP-binding protein [Gammaproteobacteria bacterium]
MSGDTIIELKNVGVRYRRKAGFMRSNAFWALHDVSFDLKHGETLGVIGRNGAGKSTLLRLLAGILAPDLGEIIRRTERVSLLALQAGFIPALTGRENAVLSGILLGMARADVESRMDDMVRFAELEQFIDEPVRTYSSGMRARLGFTVAFQADPDVLLVDEVLGIGDAGFKEKSSAAMREKIASDKTVVIVTHQPDTVLDLCDRVVWVEKGVTVEIGEPQAVVDHYQQSLKQGGKQV